MRPASLHRFTLHRSGLIPFALSGAVACGGDDDAGGETAPRDPPSLAIVALQPAGQDRWEPGTQACVALGNDPAGTIDVILSENGRIDNFTLRPPYGCEGDPQCGFVLLTLDPNDDPDPSSQDGGSTSQDGGSTSQDGGPSYQLGAAASVISVPFGTLGIKSGLHHLRVELRNELGNPVVVGDAGLPVMDEIRDLSLCDPFIPGARDAGADGAVSKEASTGGDASPPDASSTDAGPKAGAPEDATTSDVSSSRDATSDAAAPPGDASLASDAPTGG
jgi:hypothetical protein